jgi:acetoin utilization deacetylase AcuC-like enzyme
MLVYHHPDAFLHDTGPAHPERPGRLAPLVEALEERARAGDWAMAEPAEALPEDLVLLHDRGYVEEVRAAAAWGLAHLHTLDCPVSPGTWRAALLAAGAAVQGAEAVASGKARSAFSILRPPGHHARRAWAMGFCYFNGAALAAQALRTRHGLERVAVLDWDAHHGNGTQEFFYDTARVLYASLHGHPATTWPGTGHARERGAGEGEGTTLNVPIEPGTDDQEYRRRFAEIVLPALEAYRPEFLVVSCGFDAHGEDPLVPELALNNETFHFMFQETVALARRACGGRMLAVLEGGYNPAVVERLGIALAEAMASG